MLSVCSVVFDCCAWAGRYHPPPTPSDTGIQPHQHMDFFLKLILYIIVTTPIPPLGSISSSSPAFSMRIPSISNFFSLHLTSLPSYIMSNSFNSFGLSSRSVGRNNTSVEICTPETTTNDVADPESQCLLHSPANDSSDTSASTSGSSSSDSSSSRGEVCLLVVGWYVAAIACITSSKRVLLAVPFPLLLCLAQFAVSACLGRLLHLLSRASARASGERRLQLGKQQRPPLGEEEGTGEGVGKHSHTHSSSSSGSHGQSATGRECLSESEQLQLDRMVRTIALSYCLGFVCTNISFSLVSANFAETIKAGEPLSSALLGYAVLHQAYSLYSYGCLLVICLGVSLSCVGTDDFSTWGFLFAGGDMRAEGGELRRRERENWQCLSCSALSCPVLSCPVLCFTLAMLPCCCAIINANMLIDIAFPCHGVFVYIYVCAVLQWPPTSASPIVPCSPSSFMRCSPPT